MGMKGKETSAVMSASSPNNNSGDKDRSQSSQLPRIVVEGSDTTSSASSNPIESPTQPQTPQQPSGLVSGLRQNPLHGHGDRPNSAPPEHLERLSRTVLERIESQNRGESGHADRSSGTGYVDLTDHNNGTMIHHMALAGAMLRSMGDDIRDTPHYRAASNYGRSLRCVADFYDFEVNVRRTLSYGDLDRVARDNR
ncbi:hypothetical protein BaRGS_00007173 [Batillaria attramentaria]|uniref:Uncharacterized protein n=1 Tax=Batillaria attramentaria TaxID=370345 RepID=A0ABD0LQW1_9CAEN